MLGSLVEIKSSRCFPSIRPSRDSLMIIVFFGRLFGIVWYLLRLLSLYELPSIGRILISEKLRKHGLIIMDRCFLCKKDNQWIIFCYNFKWPGVYGIWALFRPGGPWVMSKTVTDTFKCWIGIRGNIHIAAVWRMILVWRMIPHCIMWCVDGEKQDGFEDRERHLDQLKRFF